MEQLTSLAGAIGITSIITGIFYFLGVIIGISITVFLVTAILVNNN